MLPITNDVREYLLISGWENEVWVKVPMFDGYEISNYARVRSLSRDVSINRKGWTKVKREGRILKQYPDGSGYVKVILRLNKVSKNMVVHRLMCMAFKGMPENYKQLNVNHIDGNKKNNLIENLEWCTAKENKRHAAKNNMVYRPCGEKCPFSKLKQSDVIAIRMAAKNGKVNRKEIAKEFNTTAGNVWLILRNKTWTHLNEAI